MFPNGIGILGVLLVLGSLIAGLKILTLKYQIHPELARKMLHIGMGVIILSFPWIFNATWPVLLLAGTSAISLELMHQIRFLREGIGSVLSRVNRSSWGEIYYPIAVGILFALTREQPLLFVIPILILSLADATAALVGVHYGQITYSTCDGCKSLEGSIGFFIVAFFSIHLPLLLFSDVGRIESVLIALVIAVLMMVCEGIAWQGLDNLFIPLGTYFLLTQYIYETPEALLKRLLATVILAIFVLAWRRRSSLDDSALMGTALFGYTAWMIGGWLWLITPLSLFLLHVWLWPACSPDARRDTVPMVLATVFTGLIWLGLYRWTGDIHLLFPYGVSFGVHLATTQIAKSARQISNRLPFDLLGQQILLAWGMVLLPLLGIQAFTGESWLLLTSIAGMGFIGITIAAGLFNTLVRWMYSPEVCRGIRNGIRALLAALGSAGVATLLWV